MQSPQERLKFARQRLMHMHPKLNEALDGVRFVDTEDESWHTRSLSSDGECIWYNSKFVNLHTVEELEFYLGYFACVRRDNLIAPTLAVEGLERWRLNLAHTYWIHRKLVHWGVGKLPRTALIHHGLTADSTLEEALALVPTTEAELARWIELDSMRGRPR